MYKVLTKCRIPFKPVLEGVRIVAFSINSHEQVQYNRVCYFLILKSLSIFEGSVFPDYLEVATASLFLSGVGKTSLCASI